MANERVYAQLDENSIVTNVFVVRESQLSRIQNWPNAVDVTGKTVGIGWKMNPDGTFSPPINPVHPISDIGELRQEGLATRDRIFQQQLERKTGQPFRNHGVTFALLGQCLIAIHESKAKTTEFFTNQAAITGEDPAQLLAAAVAVSQDVFGFLGAAWGHYRIVTTKINSALGEDEINTALRDFGNELAILASAQTATQLPSPQASRTVPLPPLDPQIVP